MKNPTVNNSPKNALPPKAFWPCLESHAHRLALSEAELARRLKITPQTLSSWKQRRAFRRSLLPNLAQVLGWAITAGDAEKMGCHLIADRVAVAPIDRHPAEVALRQADRAYRRTARAFTRYAEATPALFESIGKDCFFAFSAATSSPFEFEETSEGHALARQVASAIRKGAMCLYVRPTAEGIKYYEKLWGFGRVVRHEEAVQEIAEFRNRVIHTLSKDKKGPQLRASVAQALVYERLDQCYVPHSPMWMPGVGLGMVGWAYARDLKARMTISLPGGKFGGVLVYPQYYALEFRFGRVLRHILTCAREEIKQLAGEASAPELLGHVQLRIPDKHLNHAKQLYSKLDQMLRTVSSIEPQPDALDGLVGLHDSAEHPPKQPPVPPVFGPE